MYLYLPFLPAVPGQTPPSKDLTQHSIFYDEEDMKINIYQDIQEFLVTWRVKNPELLLYPSLAQEILHVVGMVKKKKRHPIFLTYSASPEAGQHHIPSERQFYGSIPTLLICNPALCPDTRLDDISPFSQISSPSILFCFHLDKFTCKIRQLDLMTH